MWGVQAASMRRYEVTEELIAAAAARVVELGWLKPGDRVGITAGLPSGKPGTTEPAADPRGLRPPCSSGPPTSRGSSGPVHARLPALDEAARAPRLEAADADRRARGDRGRPVEQADEQGRAGRRLRDAQTCSTRSRSARATSTGSRCTWPVPTRGSRCASSRPTRRSSPSSTGWASGPTSTCRRSPSTRASARPTSPSPSAARRPVQARRPQAQGARPDDLASRSATSSPARSRGP